MELRIHSVLGRSGGFSYRRSVIAFLRWVGILNAAVWLGGVVFFTVAAVSAASSAAMRALLGDQYFPYYSVAIEHVIWDFYFRFQITCALIAFLHLLAEWLYLGRPSRKFSFGLLTAIFLLVLIGGTALQPRVRELNKARFAQRASVADRAAAGRLFRAWNFVLKSTNGFIVAGLVIYLWRVASPSDNARFISSVKFRG